jgi:hypothetical protein
MLDAPILQEDDTPSHKASLSRRDQSNILLISLLDISTCPLVSDPILLHELLKKSVAKVHPPFANDGTWCPKMCKHIFFQNLKHNSMIIGLTSNSLHPLGNIINCHKDEKVRIRVRERSHEVDAPNIKKFHNKNQAQGHHISSSYAPHLWHLLLVEQ